jgi:hypothetical protein
MPEETHYVLPKKKNDYWTLVGCGVMLTGVVALASAAALIDGLRDRWVFGHMTGAQHLWEGKKSTPQLGDVSLALKHLSAVPPVSPEAAEAKVLENALRRKQSEMEALELARAVDRKREAEENARTAKEMSEARAAAVQGDQCDDRSPVRRKEMNTGTESEKNASARGVRQPKTRRTKRAEAAKKWHTESVRERANLLHGGASTDLRQRTQELGFRPNRWAVGESRYHTLLPYLIVKGGISRCRTESRIGEENETGKALGGYSSDQGRRAREYGRSLRKIDQDRLALISAWRITSNWNAGAHARAPAAGNHTYHAKASHGRDRYP